MSSPLTLSCLQAERAHRGFQCQVWRWVPYAHWKVAAGGRVVSWIHHRCCWLYLLGVAAYGEALWYFNVSQFLIVKKLLQPLLFWCSCLLDELLLERGIWGVSGRVQNQVTDLSSNSGASEATMWSKLVFWAVIPRVVNWASTWANQIEGSMGQRGMFDL